MAYNGGREVAYCAICGHMHDTLDPAVRYVYGDGRWECVDEVACFARRAELGMPDTVVFDELAVKRIEHAFGAMPPARPGK